MPRKEINFDKTHFYKIVCKNMDIKDCYVGHTTDFTKRKSNHKKSCNDERRHNHNYYLYQRVRENGGWENWDMVLIDTIKCENSLEARKKEREFIENLHATLNQNKRPYISPEEKVEYNHELYLKTKDIKEERRKQRRENDPEKFNDISRRTYLKRKEYFNRPYQCDCGSVCQFRMKSKHFKTLKHQQYIQSLEQSNPQETTSDKS